jgi:hypothetical protein
MPTLAWHTVRVPNPRPHSVPRRAATRPSRHRLVAGLAATVAVVLAGAVPAFAGSVLTTDMPNLGPATPGTAICTVSNTNLNELTGMVATSNGIYAIEGGATFDPSSVQIWTINPTSCQATNKNYGFDPADPQDLALGADGALWVADTGDGIGSDNQRVRVTMERVDPTSNAQAVPYRMLYPDPATAPGPPHAERPPRSSRERPERRLYRPTRRCRQGVRTVPPPAPASLTPAGTGTPNPLGVATPW